MTNKEELEKEYSDWVVKRHEDFGSFPTTAECGHYWLSKIEQIRKSDMEMVEEKIRTYWENYNYDEICLGGVLDIIKQAHETIRN